MVCGNPSKERYQNTLVIPPDFRNETLRKLIRRCVESIWYRICEAYCEKPQAVRSKNGFGFNVHGREAGRIGVDGRRIGSNFYSPDEQPELPVFA